MTILTLDRKELEKRIGKITPELEKKITDMGASRGIRWSSTDMTLVSPQVSGVRLNVARFVRANWRDVI